VKAPSLAALSKPAIQAEIVKACRNSFDRHSWSWKGSRTAGLRVGGGQDHGAGPTADHYIPASRSSHGRGEVRLPAIRSQTGNPAVSGPSEELWSQYLRTGERQLLSVGVGGVEEKRLENYVVSGLVDFDDISYDDHADLLYDLATQIVKHFEGYLSEGETAKVLRYTSVRSPASSTPRCRTLLGGNRRLRDQDQRGLHGTEAERLHGVGQRRRAGLPPCAAG